jgi:hypothetical protein
MSLMSAWRGRDKRYLSLLLEKEEEKGGGPFGCSVATISIFIVNTPRMATLRCRGLCAVVENSVQAENYESDAGGDDDRDCLSFKTDLRQQPRDQN